MQIKTTMKYHLTLIRIAIIKNKKTKITSIGKDVEKLECLYAVGGNVKSYSCCEKQIGGSSKN